MNGNPLNQSHQCAQTKPQWANGLLPKICITIIKFQPQSFHVTQNMTHLIWRYLNFKQQVSGFYPVWYAILRNSCKNYFLSVLHLYILFYLTVFYLRAQTLKYEKSPTSPPGWWLWLHPRLGPSTCETPSQWYNVSHVLGIPGWSLPRKCQGGNVWLALDTLLYNQQNTKHPKCTQHTPHTTRWATLPSPVAAVTLSLSPG